MPHTVATSDTHDHLFYFMAASVDGSALMVSFNALQHTKSEYYDAWNSFWNSPDGPDTHMSADALKERQEVMRSSTTEASILIDAAVDINTATTDTTIRRER